MEQRIFPFHRQAYVAPMLRSLPLQFGASILSNTEPIDGKDDPEIDW